MTAPASPSPSGPEFKIVDLFAGPGGLDMGAKFLRLEVVKGLEWDADACATRLAAELPTEQIDVRDRGPADFPEANVLAGGPPCQTYTVAGTGAGRQALDDVLALADAMASPDKADVERLKKRLDERTGSVDPRTGLVLEPLRWALEAIDLGRPYEAIVLEQVPAVLPVWKKVGEILKQKDYQVAHGVLRTEEFGVPQTRRRAILIARRSSKAALPESTHEPYHKNAPRDEASGQLSLSERKAAWLSMGKALGHREQPFEVVSNYGTGGDPKARGRRRSDEPSATVTGKISRNRVVGPGSKESRFSNAEAGQLQTFPACFPWSGSNIAQQIGNAIPPRLGIHVLAAALDLDKATLKSAIADLERDSMTHPVPVRA